MKQTPQENIEDWEKEFDEKFPASFMKPCKDIKDCAYVEITEMYGKTRSIKYFIKSKIKQAIKKERARIDEIIKDTPKLDHYCKCEDNKHFVSFQQDEYWRMISDMKTPQVEA